AWERDCKLKKPTIFIGSSTEGLPIAKAIRSNLSYETYPGVWHQMVFTTSSYPLDSLLVAVMENDFAILVLTPDDLTTIRGDTSPVPRTNVLFEAALFMGKHGRDRCFLVQSRQSPVLLPTDLQGIIPATYDEQHSRISPVDALGPACDDILNAMRKSVSFNRT